MCRVDIEVAMYITVVSGGLQSYPNHIAQPLIILFVRLKLFRQNVFFTIVATVLSCKDASTCHLSDFLNDVLRVIR